MISGYKLWELFACDWIIYHQFPVVVNRLNDDKYSCGAFEWEKKPLELTKINNCGPGSTPSLYELPLGRGNGGGKKVFVCFHPS